jgi:hypothetical protein
VEGSCEHGNEHSGSIKCWDYFLSGCATGSFSRKAQLHEWEWVIGSKKPSEEGNNLSFCHTSAGFLLGIFFEPEDGGDISLRNVSLSPKYISLEPKTSYCSHNRSENLLSNKCLHFNGMWTFKILLCCGISLGRGGEGARVAGGICCASHASRALWASWDLPKSGAYGIPKASRRWSKSRGKSFPGTRVGHDITIKPSCWYSSNYMYLHSGGARFASRPGRHSPD